MTQELRCDGCGQPIEPGQWYVEWANLRLHAGWPWSDYPNCALTPTPDTTS
jgi:hypothetical protein